MGEALRETAYAKINLALHVRERLPDGYHRIETLFAFAEHGDELEAKPSDHLSLEVAGPHAHNLPDGAENLVIRAAEALRCAHRLDIGAALRLTKNLPVASGLGGGSADAAAALRLLALLWELPAGEAGLGGIAATLGADVPACLHARTCFGEERGEQLRAVDGSALSGMALLLVNPGAPVPTASVFAGWDGEDRGGLELADPVELDPAWRNDLTDAALAIAPDIGPVLEALEKRTDFARMSGSGATCFGLFADCAARDAAAEEIAAAHPGWWVMRSALR